MGRTAAEFSLSGWLAGTEVVVIGQILWAVVVAVLLVAVAVGWAIRGAKEVDERMPPSRQRARRAPVEPELLTLISGRTMIFGSAALLALAFLLLARSMDRGLSLVEALVLAFAYAVLCAMATGFTVWVQDQRNTDGRTTTQSGSFKWAAWVGVGAGALAVAYLVGDVVTNLTA